MKKKIVDHIIWIVIVSFLLGSAAYAIVSGLCSKSDTLEIPWWISTVIVMLIAAPWIAIALEILITLRDIFENRERKKLEIVLNAVSIVAAVGCLLTASIGRLEINSLLPFILWMSVRIADWAIFRNERSSTKVRENPIFWIAVAVIVTAAGVVAFFTADTGKADPELPSDFSSPKVIEAWTGSFDEEKLKSTVAEYKNKCIPHTVTSDTASEPFMLVLTYNAKSAKVVRLAPVDEKDGQYELSSYIDTFLKTDCYSNIVSLELFPWFSEDVSSWTKKYDTWSYLVSVTDEGDKEHYYYFRVKYENAPTDTAE